MNPIEKAEELINRFIPIVCGKVPDCTQYYGLAEAKLSALVCTDEIIKALKQEDNPQSLDYWLEVQQEIIKI